LEIGIGDFLLSSVDSDGGIGLWRIKDESVNLIDFQNVGVRFTTVTMNCIGLAGRMKKLKKNKI
jgi:hypothetical protein